MRLQLLTLFIPAIAGFIIPDPGVASQLTLNQLSNGHAKQLETTQATRSSSALSEAFQDAYKQDGATTKASKTSPVAAWFKKALEVIDPLDNRDMDHGLSDDDCEDFGKHRRDSTLWELIEECPEASTFADLASRISDFQSLLKDSKQNVTVFVPSNDAFDRFFESTDMDRHKIPKDFLDDMMNYHSVIGMHPSCDLMCRNTIASRLQEDRLGKGVHQRLRIGVTRNRRMFMNMFAEVKVKNMYGKNGVIHGIDGVLNPPPKITDIIEYNLPTEFSTTTGAFYRTGLMNELSKASGNGLTVFAPSNRDWERLGWRATSYLFSDQGKDYLKALLRYHIVPGQNVYSDALVHPGHRGNDRKSRWYQRKSERHSGREEYGEGDLPPGYTHIRLPTLLEDKHVHVDINRYERSLSFRVNGIGKIVIADGLARDGVLQVPNNILLPPTKRGERGNSLMNCEGDTTQEANGEISVEELKALLEDYVDREDREKDNDDDAEIEL